MGGMFGESKYEVIQKIPGRYIPKTRLIKIPTNKEEVLEFLIREGFRYPMIFKPDLGERGHMVKRINSPGDIEAYLEKIKVNFLVQDLIDLPYEFGVFYTRLPNQTYGRVTSVVKKKMLAVIGDGKSTLEELILRKDRAKLQWERLKEIYRDRLHEVLAEGESMEIVSIGNHALGTMFLDGSHLINEKLSAVFDNISKEIEGFYFGRFDIRCASIEDLYEGKIMIMELNGCGAEPAHIYDPAYSLPKALKDLMIHWRNIFLISRENHKRGTAYISMAEAIRFYKKFKAATR
jgi:hypothetical protein